MTIVGIAIIAFIIGDLTKRNGNNDTDVAVINGKTLKRSQFEKMVEQEVNYYRVVREGASVSSSEERSIRDSIWANYLDDIVLGEEFKKLGLEVSDAEMNDMATGTFIHPWFANQRGLYDENGSYSRAQANNMLKYYSSSNNAIERYGWEQQMNLLKKDRLRQKYVTLVTSGFYMPNAIAKQITDYSAQGATVGVVCMPYNQVADNELTLTPDDYQNYYDKHKEEFRNMNEELRVLEYVAFDIVPSAKDFAVAEDSAKVIWNKIQSTPDSTSRALENMVRKYSKGVAKYSYDSTYNRYLPAS
ncbi:MAG: SurA N-terminal domain-containing protein, partial [Bacteroidales bacterium]|nr:SurA N-terminal domain-containing protein [Bacteroidales bacterium]